MLATLIPSLIDKGLDLFDKKFTTEAEKEDKRAELEKYFQDNIQKAWNEEQKAITDRHKNDMHSDSWLSKNIRPLVLIYLMGLFTLAFFFKVPETVLSLLKDLLMTAFVFYFGSRTLEKVGKMIVHKGKHAN